MPSVKDYLRQLDDKGQLNRGELDIPVETKIPGGIQQRAAWETEKERQSFPGEQALETLRAATVDPVVDAPLNLLQLGSSLTGVGEDVSDFWANWQYERDMETFGPDIKNASIVSAKERENIASDLVGWFMPGGALSKAGKGIEKVGSVGKSKLTKKGREAAADKKEFDSLIADANKAQQNKSIFTEAHYSYKTGKANKKVDDFAERIAGKRGADYFMSKAKYDALSPGDQKQLAQIGLARRIIKTDVMGTAGTMTMYREDGQGGARTSDKAPIEFLTMLGTNLTPSALLSLPGFVKQGAQVKAATERALEHFNNINNAEKTRVNVSPSLLKELNNVSKEFELGSIKPENLTEANLQATYESGKFGMFVVDPTQAVLVTPKLGAMILHIDKNGKYFIKGSDPKFLKPDVIEMVDGHSRAMFVPEKFSQVENRGQAYGFDSLHTVKYETLSSEASASGKEEVIIKGAEGVDNTIVNGVINWQPVTSPANRIGAVGNVAVKRSLKNDMFVKSLYDSESIPLEILKDPYLADLHSRITDVKNNVNNLLETASPDFRVNIKNQVRGNFTKFAEFNKKGPYSDIIDSLFTRDGKDKVLLKGEAQVLMDYAIDTALTKAYAKIKKNGTEFAYSIEDIPDIASAAVNEFVELTGIQKGIDIDGFKTQLIDNLRENGLSSEKLFGVAKDITSHGKMLNLTKDGSLTTVGKNILGEDFNPKKINTLVAEADILAKEGINKIKSMSSNVKDTISYAHENIKLDKDMSGKSAKDIDAAVNNFTKRLDSESLPLYIWKEGNTIHLGNDALTYMGMANTKHYFTFGKAGTKAQLDMIEAMTDIDKARFLGKITKDQYNYAIINKKSLRETIANDAGYTLVKEDIDGLHREIDNYNNILDNYSHSNGMTFGVMKVSTGRLQYTGAINPQQGVLSKFLMTSSSKNINDANMKSFKADSIRTAIDEVDELLDLLTPDELLAAGITREGFKTIHWKADDSIVISVGDKIANRLDEKINMSDMSLKERTAYRTIIDGIKKDKPSHMVAEVDAVTSMQGITDMYMKNANHQTGVGAELVKGGKDVYTVFGEIIAKEKIFPFYTLDDAKGLRSLSKDRMLSGGYGESPYNIAYDAVDSYLTKALIEGNVDGLAMVSKMVKANIRFIDKDFIKDLGILEAKVSKIEKAQDIIDSLKYNMGSSGAGTTASKNLRASAIVKNIDHLESIVMKAEAGALERIVELDAIINARDSLKALAFVDKIESGKIKYITLDDVKAASHTAAIHRAEAVRTALTKAFSEDFTKLQGQVEVTFERGYVHTRLVLENTKVTEQLKNSVYKDLNIKGLDKKLFDTAISSGQIKTLWQLVDALHLKGKDPLTSGTIYNILPGLYNGLGDKVLFVANKPSGYHTSSRMQYSGLTPITNPLPYLLHSTDASLMGIGSAGNSISHRWDAIYGNKASFQGRRVNQAMAEVYGSVNIFDNLLDAYHNAERSYRVDGYAIGNEAMEMIYEDSARRAIVGAGIVLDAKKKTNMQKAMKSSFLDADSPIHERLSKDKELIDNRIHNIGEEISVNNMTNGSTKTRAKVNKSTIPANKFTGGTTDVQFRSSKFDISNLKNIDTDGFNINEMQGLKMLSVEHPMFTTDINSLSKAATSKFDAIGNKITMSKTAKDKGFFIELAHEVVHSTGIDIFGAKKVAEKFGNLAKQLDEQGIQIGVKKNGSVRVFDKGLLESKADIAEIDVDLVYGNELSASMLDRLIANELVYANDKTIATLRNTNELTSEVSPLVMIDNTGRAHNLYTVNDLNSFLHGRGLDGYTPIINDYASGVLGVINGSTKIRNFIYDKPANKFETTLNNINADMKGINKAIKSANSAIQEYGFLDLFAMDKNVEVMQNALGKSKGVEKTINGFIAAALEKMEKDFSSEFGVEAAGYSKSLGNAWLMGLNKLLFEKMNNRFDYLNVELRGDMIRNGSLVEEAVLQQRFNSAVNKFFKDISNNSKDPSIIAYTKQLQNDIKALADGSSGYKIGSVAKKVQKFADIHMKDSGLLDSKLAVQKLASMYIIGKNSSTHKQFINVYNKVGIKPDVFESYMQQANVHSNPYSLFGENVEMQFIEDGKTARFVPIDSVRMDEPGVIGTGKASDGTKYALVTIDKSEKFLAKQESNLITVELSDFESGLFKESGIEFNGQRAIATDHHIDKSIIKQISRNMYVNKFENLNKDLGYTAWQMMRDQGILMTLSEKTNIESTGSKREFVKLSENNPIRKTLGVDFYYDKRYNHYFEGTPGVDVRSLSKSLVGDTDFAKFVEGTATTLYKATNVMKRFILVARPQSYINSYVSSMFIYGTHAKGLNYLADHKKASSEIANYKKKLNTYVDMYVDPKRQAEAQNYWNKEIEPHSVNKLMKSGIMDTIRSDIYKIGSTREMDGYSAILKATGSKEYANGFKTMLLADNTSIGAIAAKAFDNTELHPKLMLYYNLVKDLGHDKAVTTVLMSFPSYHNLPQMLNLLNTFSPYTKFFASTPRMIGYGVNKHPGRMAAGVLFAQAVVPASYAMSSEEEQKRWEWHKEHGFMKIPLIDAAYPTFSLFPLWSNPFDSPFGSHMFQTDFLFSVAGGIDEPKNYIPGSRLPSGE